MHTRVVAAVVLTVLLGASATIAVRGRTATCTSRACC
jgi:hypothetical protein